MARPTDAVQRRIEPSTGLHVPHDMFDVRALVRAPSTGQDPDVLARGRQLVDDDAAYSSGAAGYEYTVRHVL